MNNRVTDSLLQFCVSQRNAFDPQAWMEQSHVYGKAMAVTAKYLSMTNWYGHEDELKLIALETDEHISSGAGFEHELLETEIDLGHFSALVRYGIALRELKS